MSAYPIAQTGEVQTPYYSPPNQPRMTDVQYFKSPLYTQLDPSLKRAIVETKNAVGCIFTDDGQVNGTALIIGRGLILVPKHCFPGLNGTIRFNDFQLIEATTIIDGEFDPVSGFKADYKILFSQKVYDLNLQPAKLSVSVATGSSLQINYQLNEQLYIIPYQSVDIGGGYATRSDLASVITMNGDSGGARFSMNAKAVHSIHQGESEALKINDIYYSLGTIQDNSGWVKYIFDELKINIIDLIYAGMDYSTIALQAHHVIPERHGILEVVRTKRESIYKIPPGVVEDIFSFISSFTTVELKKDLYAKAWSQRGTKYRYPAQSQPGFNTHDKWGTRFDVESQRSNAANLQIQVRGQTVATVLVSNELIPYATTDDKISAVVNYILRIFETSIYHANKNEEAIDSGIAFIGRCKDVYQDLLPPKK